MDAEQTIGQLGGRRIFAMAFDAKRSVTAPNELRLRIAHGLAGMVGATHVVIALAADDTYTVSLVKVRRFDFVTTASEELVHADSLRRTVETMSDDVAEAQLVRWGAERRQPDEDPLAWIQRWRSVLTRPMRHRGNHRYLWCLDKRKRRAVLTAPALAYPKAA